MSATLYREAFFPPALHPGQGLVCARAERGRAIEDRKESQDEILRESEACFREILEVRL